MKIERRILGRTSIEATILGLGGGGNSRLGLSSGMNDDHATAVVKTALDLGINLVDTARGYGTEGPTGRAIAGRDRKQVVVSSKSPYLDEERKLLSVQAFEKNIEKSLSELGLETIDIYFIHGLRLPFYEACRERFLPVLERACRDGKVRFTGVTEAFESDTRHEMLQRAVQDNWDVVMVGFNLINQTARERVLAVTRQKGIGTLGMFAVRRGLINESTLRPLLLKLAESGEIDSALAATPDLMQALGLQGVCQSLSEAAYRFAAYEPGMDCVLAGSGSPDHLKENLAAVSRGPLPPETVSQLRNLFGRVESITAQGK